MRMRLHQPELALFVLLEVKGESGEKFTMDFFCASVFHKLW